MPRLVIFCLVVALMSWASSFVAIRLAVAAYSPGHLALLRFLMACVLLLGVAWARRMPLPRLRHLPVIFLHGFLGFFVYHVAINHGMRTISAASGSFLIGAIPVFVAIFAMFFLAERLGGRGWLGIFISFGGLALIAFGEGGGMSVDAGALWVLLAALSEGLYYVSIKPKLKEYGAVTYTAYTIFSGTLLMLIFSPGLWSAVASAPPRATWSVVYLAVFPTAFAYICWNYAVSRVEVSRVAVTQYLMPGLTIILGWLVLAEVPPPLALIGGLVAIAGVVLVNTPRRPRRFTRMGVKPTSAR